MVSARYIEKSVREDLEHKMVFVAGPRQVGKTTLALRVARTRRAYLNWDVPEHRERILRRELPNTRVWALDEIHKYRGWRNWLKGIYDASPDARILVTGSARLDFYRFGGDSLQGRYHLHRLHPLSVGELQLKTPADAEHLLKLGGFPEPYFRGSERHARRWSREYRNLLIREEISTLERIDDVGRLELLMLALPDRVGSPLSINALREDLEVSHKTIARWLSVLERLYALVRIPPFGAPRLRAVKKEQKHYHYDWTLVREDGARFECLVAAHLAKWVHRQQDHEGRDLELRYFRDVDRREVDFVVVERREPVLMVECKLAEAPLDRGLRYLNQRFPQCEAWQIHLRGTKDVKTPEGVRIAPAMTFLSRLP